MTYSEAIVTRLKSICEERNLTINRLATLSGLRQSTIANITDGRTKNPTLRTLHCIAVGLNMTVSEFLDFNELNNTLFEDE